MEVKLSKIRDLITTHKSPWIIRQIYQEKEEIIELNKIISPISNCSGEHVLQPEYLLKLFIFSITNSEHILGKNLQQILKGTNPSLFKLFLSIRKLDLLNQDFIALTYQLSTYEIKKIRDIVDKLKEEEILINIGLLREIIKLNVNGCKDTIAILIRINNNYKLNQSMSIYFQETLHFNNIYALDILFLLLDKALVTEGDAQFFTNNQFSFSHLMLFKKLVNFPGAYQVIKSFMTEPNLLPMDKDSLFNIEYLVTVLKTNSLTQLNENIFTWIVKNHSQRILICRLITANLLTPFIIHSWPQEVAALELMKELSDKDLLNASTIKTLITNYSPQLSSVDILLIDNHLLTDSIRDRLNKLTNINLNYSIQQLYENNNLTPTNLNVVISLCEENLLTSSDTLTLIKLLPYLKSNKLASVENILSVMRMPTKHLKRIINAVTTLANCQLLTQKSLNKILNDLVLKLNKVDETPVKINNGADVVGIEISNGTTFFLKADNKNIAGIGMCGFVEKGYADSDTQQPTFGVKTQYSQKIKIAKREVKFNQLLGRNSFYYNHSNSLKVVYDWQQGKSLCDYSEEEILKISLGKRLECFKCCLKQLATIHAYYRIHGDCNSGNLILNTETSSLNLIDFGFSTRGENHFAYADEINNLGEIILNLFSDISLDSPKSFMEKAISQLINAMTNKISEKRCSAQDAWFYCKSILQNKDHLSDDNIAIISYASIHRNTVRVEDALHGRRLSLCK